MININDYKVIFFDLFFTLISTYKNDENKPHECDVLGIDRSLWTKTAVGFMDQRSKDASLTPYDITSTIIKEINPDIAESLILEATNARINRFKETVIDVDQVNLDVLKKLNSNNIKLCLISNADVIDIISWDESPLKAYFDEVVFSCQVGMAKPDPGIYKHALNLMGAEPKDCLFIGDGGSNELEGAKKCGMMTALTTQYRGILWPETISHIKEHADFTLNHLSDLIK